MIEIKTKEELEKTLKTPGKVFIKIGHEHCGPCKVTEANILKVMPLYPDVTFAKVDTDECDEDVLEGITTVPTIYYKKEVEGCDKPVLLVLRGLMTEEKIKNTLDDAENK